MKFYSDVTMKLYDTQEQLEADERKFNSQNLNKRMAKADKLEKNDEVKLPSKKQLAAEVEAAESKVNEAQANLELAKQRAQGLSKKYLEELDGIMEPAKQQLKDAQRARYEAIQRFNEAYGAYQTTYTGARAADEFARAVSDLTTFFPGLFRF